LANSLNDTISAQQLLSLIPDEAFASIVEDTNVDYQVKKIFGRNLFYLLLYGLMEIRRMSLRSLEEVYRSKKFKFLFNLNAQQHVKYNSISTRLSNINVEFFEEVYQLIYSKFSALIPPDNAFMYKVTRVDSTMVSEAANKIEEGMLLSNQYSKKKHIKYTISLTELLPSSVEVFTKQSAASEDEAIPPVVLKNVDKKKDNVFVFDRGVGKRDSYCKIDDEGFHFITRLSKNSRYEILREYRLSKNVKIGNLAIRGDYKVHLFSNHKKYSHVFRLIVAVNENKVPLLFLTNLFDLSIEEIINTYKRRWDIEVFFRFIKQELNFKHFMSTNINGIKVVLYMTLILSMLVIIFKKVNNLGFKIATQRFYYQLDDLVLDMLVILSGGDPNLVFR
jgi:hypothetical protein